MTEQQIVPIAAERVERGSTLAARLRAIEADIAALTRLVEEQGEHQEQRFKPIDAFLDPGLDLESFLKQLFEVGHTQTQAFMQQSQAFMTLARAINAWLAHIDASDRAAEQERAAGG